MHKLRIYVAGPYSPQIKDNSQLEVHRAIQEAAQNVQKAIEVGLALIEKGHYPFIPHLSHYVHTNPACKKDFGYWYYGFDITFLDSWAEALFYLAPSKGADMELQRAEELGLLIFTKLKDVPKAECIRLVARDLNNNCHLILVDRDDSRPEAISRRIKEDKIEI